MRRARHHTSLRISPNCDCRSIFIPLLSSVICLMLDALISGDFIAGDDFRAILLDFAVFIGYASQAAA